MRGLGVLVVVIVFSFLFTNEAFACRPKPTPTPTPTPTIIVTPTPTAGSSATLTSNSTGGTGISDNRSSSPQATQPNNPVCNGIYPNKPLLQGFTRLSETSIQFSFWGVTADNYIVSYGYSPTALNFGIPYLPNTSTSFEIDALAPNVPIFAQVIAKKGACYSYSLILDPQ